MNHEDCRYLLDSLSPYIDGELDADLCAQIERHMEGCDNCRIVVDSLRKTIYLYQASSAQTPVPEGVRERLYSSLKLDDLLGKAT